MQATFLTLSQTTFAENPHHLVDILGSRQSSYCVDIKHGFIIYSLNFMIRKNEGRNSLSIAIINYVTTRLHCEEGRGCAPKTWPRGKANTEENSPHLLPKPQQGKIQPNTS
jgi:hypothetical protein